MPSLHASVALSLLLCAAAQHAAAQTAAHAATLKEERPDVVRHTIHFLVGEAGSKSLVKAVIPYQCQACGNLRVKRLRKSACWECGAARTGAGVTERITVTLWPGCDPTVSQGQCDGPSRSHFAAFPKKGVQLSSNKADAWGEKDKEVFNKMLRGAILPVLDAAEKEEED